MLVFVSVASFSLVAIGLAICSRICASNRINSHISRTNHHMNVWDPLLTTIIIIGDTAHAKQGPTLASQVASENLRTSDLLQPYPPLP